MNPTIEAIADACLIEAALSYSWNEPVQLENWKLPPGAYGDSAGSI